MEFQEFTRRPFDVKAVQITEDNVEEVAKWCGGKVRRFPNKVFLKIFDNRPPLRSQGNVTDWVLERDKGRYRIYTDLAFKSTFDGDGSRNVFDEDQLALIVEDGEIRHRDAVTGQYVTEKFAEDNPDTTVKENDNE